MSCLPCQRLQAGQGWKHLFYYQAQCRIEKGFLLNDILFGYGMVYTPPDTTKHSFDFNAFMREELADKVLIKLPAVFGIDLSITKDVLMMLIAAVVIVVFCYLAMRRPKLIPVPTSLQNILETMAEFLENDVAKPFLGEQTRRFMPFLLTAFLFILANNLMGVIPGATKATANISVTAGLAGITFVVVMKLFFSRFHQNPYQCRIFFITFAEYSAMWKSPKRKPLVLPLQNRKLVHVDMRCNERHKGCRNTYKS